MHRKITEPELPLEAGRFAFHHPDVTDHGVQLLRAHQARLRAAGFEERREAQEEKHVADTLLAAQQNALALEPRRKRSRVCGCAMARDVVMPAVTPLTIGEASVRERIGRV